jgi:predicted PurR-regulated permease PerM
MRDLEEKTFLALLIAVSLMFAWILWPYRGAVLWGTVFAILFEPLYRRLSRSMHQHRNLAAFVTVALILLIVILPLSLIGALLVQEASGVYATVQNGDVNFGRMFHEAFNGLPGWAINLLAGFGLTEFGDVQERLSGALARASQFLAAQAINIGQHTFDFAISLFVMLYLLFFLLRDGDVLVARIRDAIPLSSEKRRALFSKFSTVIRATVKGNVVVAAAQGALGGLIFWILGIHAPLLWAVLMALLSLLPAIGAALVWVPAALYFLATGAIWQGIVLMAYGIVVISTIDNILRPILVGRDTRMPDYVVLVSTLGGIAIFGVNGFVIGPVTAALFIAAWDLFSASRP